jgi:hypothetical protein
MDSNASKQRKYSTLFRRSFSNTPAHEAVVIIPDHLIQLQNVYRETNLVLFRKELLTGMNRARTNLSNEGNDQSEVHYEYIYSLAKNVTKWIIHRHAVVTEWVKTKQTRGKDLIRSLENYHWCLLALQLQSREIDQKIWVKYAVQVEGMSEEMPLFGENEIETMKDRASFYFLSKLQDLIYHSQSSDLVDALLYITQLATFKKLFSLLLPRVLTVVPANQFEDEVLPKICIYGLTYRKSFTGAMLESLLKTCQNHVSADLINSIIEYSSHCLDLNLLGFIFDVFKELVRTEGILCGLLAATIKGNQQLMAVYHFYLLEKLQDLYTKEQEISRFGSVTDISDFLQFVPPFMYILFAVSSDAVHAINDVVFDLVEFYEKEPMKDILIDGGISRDLHLHFIDGIFNWACKLNHFNVISTLLEGDWLKTDFVTPITNAVKEGHQKILHLLLETLLGPDPVLELSYGAIPLCFRKSEALRLLPVIATRFPVEASWFVNAISNIPIPIAVPPSENMDPIVKPTMVKGMKLGSSSLLDVTTTQDFGIPHETVWSKLDRVGQLHNVSSKTSSEVESIICMVPDIFLKEKAIRPIQKAGSFFSKETNALIRLLATEEEDIILSPIIQGLMEYHWTSGHFWIRFGYQFLSTVCFIILTAILFGNPVKVFPSYAISSLIVVLSAIFLIQEIRQYIDDSKAYVKSGTNLIDLLIYSATIVIIVVNYFVQAISVHPLIKALIILFSTMRLLLHLRIFPSVGPIVRITSSALLNVVPILVPMLFLLIAYSTAFYIIHQELIGNTTNFNSIPISIQYTTTMITFDYT